MTQDLGTIVWWLAAAVQIAGLASAWLTRWPGGARRMETCCQLMFLATMSAVAGAVMLALAVGNGGWIVPSCTLTVMIVAATCDFRQPSSLATSTAIGDW